MRRLPGELLQRHPANPILTFRDLPYNVNAVYNPGAAKFGGQYVLVPRVEYGNRDNDLHLAFSRDGVNFEVAPEPFVPRGSGEDAAWEKHRYDARVTLLEGQYYIVYCAQTTTETVRIGAVRTADFRNFERLPFQTAPWSRNCALFPERIAGKYARFERPMNGNGAITFVSFSPDLAHWGGWKPINLQPETWMREKWGIGPPPIRTSEGWLLIIHGVWFALGYVYRLGAVLLDLDDPSIVRGQCPEFLLTPREPYERVGEVPNCVFSNGVIAEPDGTLKIYYGAADTCIGLATVALDDVVAACLQGVKPPRLMTY